MSNLYIIFNLLYDFDYPLKNAISLNYRIKVIYPDTTLYDEGY